MSTQEKVLEFKKYQQKMHAFNHAMGILFYDSETCMPKGASENLGKTIAVLSEELYKIQTAKELSDIIDNLKGETLDEQTAKELKEIIEEKEKTEKIPVDEFIEYQVVRNEATHVWQTAKGESDYESFKPLLEKLIAYKKKFAKYQNPQEENIYNILLDDFEKGLTTDVLDIYFEKLRTDLVPLIAKINEKADIKYDFMAKKYPIELQRKLADYLMDVLSIDKNFCAIGETEHPFSTNFDKTDVRITTNYKEDSLASSFYSVIHEGGHGLYELNTGDNLKGTVLASGTSMGIHESQSRFFENIIGRSKEFCNLVLPKMKEIFPEQLKNVTTDEFYKAVNKVTPSLIRIEADELTYSMHIMIRYEIEKAIFQDKVSVDELPALWNKLYKDYLGVTVPSHEKGILQDVHWSSGLFGYFPSYSIGSAYASQIAESMKKDIDLNKLIAENNLKPVVEWLTEHIYKYGKMLTPNEVIKNSCKADFSADFYVKYLSDKYSKIYDL